MKRMFMQSMIILIGVLVLSGCGGGNGGGGGDTTKPVIHRNGSATVSLTVGDTYTDAGATATDDTDGNITNKIVVHNPVDTAVAGTYTVTYDVSDAAGNAADQVTRTVTVNTVPDTTKPVIHRNGSATVSLTVGDTYTDAGATATDDTDGNITNKIVVHNPVDTAVAGTYTVTYDVSDAAGNAADQVTRTVTVAAYSVTYHGTTYGAVKSPYTDKIWLDRNLGASQVCTSFDDGDCYGDYYQWGRNVDGHEKITSDATASQAVDISSSGDKFIKWHTDWASVDTNGSARAAQWASLDGSSVCPAGFRVPTVGEIKAELFDPGSAQIQNRDDAYDSFLKLPSAGERDTNGNSHDIDTKGYLWTVIPNESPTARYLVFGETTHAVHYHNRAAGLPVRCIKTTEAADIIPPVIDITPPVSKGVVKGHAYSDPGATATDNVDGTVAVTTSGSVNTSATGAYILTYAATDSAGNTATKQRQVIVYGTVTSPYSSKKWLDRNLGATRVCTSGDDAECRGDYYQWGRLSDGHEKFNSETAETQMSSPDHFGDGNFIIKHEDWTTADSDGSIRNVQWTTDRKGICPDGFVVPSESQINTEATGMAGESKNAYQSFLTLPLKGGYRYYDNANLINTNSFAAIWFATPSGTSDAKAIKFDATSGSGLTKERATGIPVRCIEK